MRICGLLKLTLLDFPGRIACTVFTGGCDFRCPFCHNGPLVLPQGELPEIPVGDVLDFLEKRRGLLEGVCVTGGEPTLQRGLLDFLRQVKEMGYAVKLDTNGAHPDILSRALEAADYVAMDIKSSRQRYGAVCGIPGFDVTPVEESASLLRRSGIVHEFRTTLVKGLHTLEDMDDIGVWLTGAPRYFLQRFRDGEGVIRRGFQTFSQGEMEGFQTRLARWIPAAAIRG